jgi:zinc protease
MVEAVLSGASFGGPATHRSARLYRALVETDIAVDASASYHLTIDPGVISFEGTVRDGHTLAEFEAAVEAEIDRLIHEPVSEAELAKIIKQTRAQFAYALERVSNQARWLGWLEMLGDWQRFYTLADSLAAVTAEDIQQAAQKYLKTSNRTTGWFEPANPP